MAPAWSPDGKHLAYLNALGLPAGESVVVVTDGAGHEVASFPGAGWTIAWSPDSTRIATWVGPGVGPGETIAVYGLDGTRQALLTMPPGFGPHRDEDPTWSHDGALLISLLPDSGGDPRQIWELPVDGGAPRPLPAIDPRQVDSPDGTRVATGCRDSAVRSASLVITEADGTELRVLPGASIGSCSSLPDPSFSPCRPLSGAVYEDPVWSPTGDRVAFTWNWSGGLHELCLVNVASGAVTMLAGDDGITAIGFSAEGDRILFSRTDASDLDSLWAVDADGSHPQTLVSGTVSGGWQPLPADH